MFKFGFLAILFLALADAPAQTTVYVIDGGNGDPLPNVNVHGGSFTGTTNGKGGIIIKAEASDTITFSYIGYAQARMLFSALRDKQTIPLAPASITTGDVLVTGGKTSPNSFTETIKPPHTGALYNDAADLLRTQSTFFVKDYGNASSAKTVSSRGMSSENTVVLFNEARINDLRSGFFDFQNVSINSIEKIEIVKGAEQDNSFSGAGGVVKITTGNFEDETRLNLSARYGFDNLQSYYGGLKGALGGKAYYSVFAERSFSPNEFKYNFEGEAHERASAAFNKTLAGLDFRYTFGKSILKNYSHYSYLNSGIPGAVVSNNNGANRLSNISTAFVDVLNFGFPISASLYSKNTFAVNINKFAIYDPDRIVFFPEYDRTSKLNEFQLVNTLSYSYKQLSLSAGNFIQSSSLKDNSNMNILFKKPDTYSRVLEKMHLSAGYLDGSSYYLIKNINYFAWGSYVFLNEKSDEDNSKNFGAYKVGISFQTNTDLYIKFMSSYSNDSREPSYNERFYSELNRYGDVPLKNESYRWFDIDAESSFDLFGKTSISAVFFQINADNKIVWIPVGNLPGLQKPRNQGRIESSGAELSLRKDILKKIHMSMSFVYNKALNKTHADNSDHSYNKQLIYAPVNRFNYTLSYEPVDNASISLSGYYSGTTYYSTDNDPDYSLKSYFIHDLALSYLFKTGFAGVQAGFNIYNIFNKTYFIIQSYPMPLRNYSFTLSLEI
jgi:outer membrane cobalamin receptor